MKLVKVNPGFQEVVGARPLLLILTQTQEKGHSFLPSDRPQ